MITRGDSASDLSRAGPAPRTTGGCSSSCAPCWVGGLLGVLSPVLAVSPVIAVTVCVHPRSPSAQRPGGRTWRDRGGRADDHSAQPDRRPAAAPCGWPGRGLRGVAERVELLGASLAAGRSGSDLGGCGCPPVDEGASGDPDAGGGRRAARAHRAAGHPRVRTGLRVVGEAADGAGCQGWWRTYCWAWCPWMPRCPPWTASGPPNTSCPHRSAREDRRRHDVREGLRRRDAAGGRARFLLKRSSRPFARWRRGSRCWSRP